MAVVSCVIHEIRHSHQESGPTRPLHVTHRTKKFSWPDSDDLSVVIRETLSTVDGAFFALYM